MERKMKIQVVSYGRTSVDLIKNDGDYNLINSCECEPEKYLNILSLPGQISVEYDDLHGYSMIVYTSANTFDEVTCLNMGHLEANKTINDMIKFMVLKFQKSITVDWKGSDKTFDF
jgi:hypothetical protein